MPETRSAPTVGTVLSNWMAMDSLADRVDDDYGLFGGVDNEAVIEPAPDIAGARRSRRTAEKVRAVIAEATGVELDELDGIDFSDMDTVAEIVTHDLTEPAATFAALDVVLRESRIDQHRND